MGLRVGVNAGIRVGAIVVGTGVGAVVGMRVIGDCDGASGIVIS